MLVALVVGVPCVPRGWPCLRRASRPLWRVWLSVGCWPDRLFRVVVALGLPPFLLTIQGGRLSCGCMGLRAFLVGVLSGCLGAASGVPPSVAAGRVRCGSDCLLFWWSGCVSRAGRMLVGGWLPLVCASGVLSGLHPPPFYLSVFGLGVPLWCACSVCLVCVWSGCVPHIFAPTFAPDIFALAFDT